MKLFVFGSSITSSYWNGAATYYRGIYKQLAARGCEVTFAEPDVYQRQAHRDACDLDWLNSVVYRDPHDLAAVLSRAGDTDLVIKHSGVGASDALLEAEVLKLRSARTRVAFWDVDAPATLARVRLNSDPAFRELIPEYDFIFTYGGGDAVVNAYLNLGAQCCYPIYNALDPQSHYPVARDAALQCDLVFVGNRLPDRERRVEEFFLRLAELAPGMSFILGGEGWGDKRLPGNVRWIGHVATADHNRVNCSARMVLNINRDSMADVGFSPPTRIFEAAGAGACVVTDRWPGIDSFFHPGVELFTARRAEDIAAILREVSAEHAALVGAAMRQRALKEHTYARRADLLHSILTASRSLAAREAS